MSPLSNEQRAAIETTIQWLETQRNEVQQEVAGLQARLKELHNSISTLNKSVNLDAPASSRPSTSVRLPGQKYANMSVRWAILDLLIGSNPMSTAEIAEALLAEGVQTKATNFVNNVSAVLSTTMKDEPHKEVQQLPDGRWELTEKGRDAIDHIRTTPKFQGALRGRYVGRY